MSERDGGPMSWAERFVEFVTERSAIVIVLVLLLTVVLGYGMTSIDDESGLDQFQFDSEEAQALDYIERNFEPEDDQTATVQIVVRDEENALSRDSLISTLALQQEMRDDERISGTLAAEPFADVASIVATVAIRGERGTAIEQRREALEQDRAKLRSTGEQLADLINETRNLQQEYIELNASLEQGEIDQETYESEAARIQEDLGAVETQAAELLEGESLSTYMGLLSEARSLEREFAEVERAYRAGEIDESERQRQLASLAADLEGVYSAIEEEVLAEELAALEERGEALAADAQAVQQLDPTLDQQREQLEGMSDQEVQAVVERVLGEDAPREALVFVPMDYQAGSATTDARQLFVTQTTAQEIVEGEAPPEIVDAQLAIDDVVDDRFGDDAFVYGAGIISDEIDRSMGDSMVIVLPLALLFVVIVLTIAYRDILDILLGIIGIALVLVWTFGFMGWADIAFNQIMIAVPVLLVGLSIDYAIHVFMRHREQRDDGYAGTRPAMAVVLLGLGSALVWVTVTAVIGFLSNLVSPVAPIREFGLVSAFGIASTLVIFGTFVPATKVGIDDFLESRGWDRHKRAFGTGGGPFTEFLSGGYTLSRRAPALVLVVVLLLTAGGAYGASQVDTTFQQEDFIADEPPGWMQELPEPFAPGEYSVKQNLEFVNERFLRQDTSTQVLIQGNVASDDALEGIADARDVATSQDVVVTLSDGKADVRSPLSVMESVAAKNETFAATFEEADTTGNGVPDENVTAVYDALFETAPERASDVIYRVDGEYEATRMIISIQGDAIAADATDATREVAATLDHSAIATGQLVVFNIVEEELFNTVIQSLLVTMVAVFAFLMVAYRFAHGSALLGAVTLIPILLSVAWILGTMYLMGIPFNVLTGTITSLTIGLGVAYNIHMSERYRLEIRRGHDVWGAMRRAVTGTGGALLGSAATTAGGFGVLAFAILPPLQQFGIITGLTIIYAFLGSVFVLPSFLILWTRYLGPSEEFPDEDATPGADTPEPSPDGSGTESSPPGDAGGPSDGSTAGAPDVDVAEFDPPKDGPGDETSDRSRAGDDHHTAEDRRR